MSTYPNTTKSPKMSQGSFFSSMFHEEINENMNQAQLMNDVSFFPPKQRQVEYHHPGAKCGLGSVACFGSCIYEIKITHHQKTKKYFKGTLSLMIVSKTKTFFSA